MVGSSNSKSVGHFGGKRKLVVDRVFTVTLKKPYIGFRLSEIRDHDGMFIPCSLP